MVQEQERLSGQQEHLEVNGLLNQIRFRSAAGCMHGPEAKAHDVMEVDAWPHDRVSLGITSRSALESNFGCTWLDAVLTCMPTSTKLTNKSCSVNVWPCLQESQRVLMHGGRFQTVHVQQPVESAPQTDPCMNVG